MASDADNKPDPAKKEPKEVSPAITPQVLNAEFVEAAKQLNVGQIQINVLLQAVIQRAPSTEELVAQSTALIQLAEKDAEARLKIFKATADAVIEAKTKDPDEIAKRADNSVRRWLKVVMAGSTIVSLILGALAVYQGEGIVLSGLLLVIGMVGLAMLGPLASGESLSTNDVVKLVNAVKGLIPRENNSKQQQSKGKK